MINFGHYMCYAQWDAKFITETEKSPQRFSKEVWVTEHIDDKYRLRIICECSTYMLIFYHISQRIYSGTLLCFVSRDIHKKKLSRDNYGECK